MTGDNTLDIAVARLGEKLALLSRRSACKVGIRVCGILSAEATVNVNRARQCRIAVDGYDW